MSDRPGEKMTYERFAQIVDAYGAAPLRWPTAERLAAQAFAARDARALSLLAEEENFDALMAQAPAAAPSAALAGRILRAAPRPGFGRRIRSFWADLFPATPAWRPALGFAAALAAGAGLQAAAADRLGLDAENAVVETTQDDDAFAPLGTGASVYEEDML